MVVAIIGILATVVLALLGSARTRAQEAKLLATARAIETGLEMYYLDNGSYPYMLDADGSYDPALWDYGHNDRWLTLSNTLKNYVQFDPLDVIAPDGSNKAHLYYNSANPNYYGLAVAYPSSNTAAANDGVYFANWYEIGPSVYYCIANYTGTSASWTYSSGSTTICAGGN